jgi:alkylhydroperoxidase family enzyme
MPLVGRIDEATLAGETRAAFDAEAARAGQVTNMKATLLHSLTAFRVFDGWRDVKAAVRRAVGERGLTVYSLSISERGGCLLCSTYFRRLLLDEGIAPADYAPDATETLLIGLAAAVAGHRAPEPALAAALAARFDAATLVDLTVYGATMLATNVFNNVIGVPLDAYLEPYRAPAPERLGERAA